MTINEKTPTHKPFQFSLQNFPKGLKKNPKIRKDIIAYEQQVAIFFGAYQTPLTETTVDGVYQFDKNYFTYIRRTWGNEKTYVNTLKNNSEQSAENIFDSRESGTKTLDDVLQLKDVRWATTGDIPDDGLVYYKEFNKEPTQYIIIAPDGTIYRPSTPLLAEEYAELRQSYNTIEELEAAQTDFIEELKDTYSIDKYYTKKEILNKVKNIKLDQLPVTEPESKKKYKYPGFRETEQTDKQG